MPNYSFLYLTMLINSRVTESRPVFPLNLREKKERQIENKQKQKKRSRFFHKQIIGMF